MANRSTGSPASLLVQSTSTNKMQTKNRPTSILKNTQNTSTPRSKVSPNASTPLSKFSPIVSTPPSKYTSEESAAQLPLHLQKARHLSSFAMPSPASTPGAEHLSDVSSCCSIDGSDSNRSSPTSSITSSCLSIPAEDMRTKYKDELWSAIRSDYRYLMGEEIIDTCRSTESDLSLESDDQGSFSPAVSFKDYLRQYNELNTWLGSVLQRTRRQSNCLSERYVNETYHEDMLSHLTSLKHFKEYAKQLMHSCPQLRDDINQHLKQVNEKWEALEKLLLPNARHCDKRTMLNDMELDLDQLMMWVDEMVVRLRNWRLRPHWTTDDIIRQLESQMMLQAQIESHSKVVRSVLSLCDRLTNEESGVVTQKSCSDGEDGLDDRRKATELRRQVIEVQGECNRIWLCSLEWQMTLEDAKNNGIHRRHDLEINEDQWDRSRFAGFKKQSMDLATVPEGGTGFTDGDNSFFMNARSPAGKGDAEIEEYTEDENTEEELFCGQDADHGVLSESHIGGIFVDSCGRSLSDPVLGADVGDNRLRQREFGQSPEGIELGNSSKEMDLSEAVSSPAKADGGFSREWSPGQLRRCGAIDLVAAFDKDAREAPVDVGYSSGSHSTEETDSSAKQDSFAWSLSQNCLNQRQDARTGLCTLNAISMQRNETSCAKHEAGAGSYGPEGADIIVEMGKPIVDNGAVRCLNDSIATVASSSNEPQSDLRDIPETEDEMSVELPLDDVPLMRSSDLNLEDGGSGPPQKKPTARTSMRRSLHFAEDTSTSDFDAKFSVHRASPKKKGVTGRAIVAASQTLQKGKPDADDAPDGVKKRKAKRAVTAANFVSLSGSCYASSEGTESESDEANQGVPKRKSSSSCLLPIGRWGGSASLRSSPVKDMAAEATGRRSPLKRRMSESLDNVLDGFCHVQGSQRWNSDSAIYQRQSEEFSSSKIRRMSAFSHAERGEIRSEDAGRSTRANKNRSQGYRRRQEIGQKVTAGDLATTSLEQVVPCSAVYDDLSVFVGRDDALVPSCDSLNSSSRDLMTPDGSQMCSDDDKNAEVEMHWQEEEDAYYRDHCEDEDEDADFRPHEMLSAYAMSHNVSHDSMSLKHDWMDSDSDFEDFQHVLQESRRGLKFIESTIRLDCGGCENGMPHQDPAAFKEPLATCKTNISCLQELIDALKSKNKMDNEIHQVNDIVSRWQQLESDLLALQREAQLVASLKTELQGISAELENLAKEAEFDKFDDIHQLEDTLKTVKAMPFKINQKVHLRLDALETAWYQFEAERDHLDSQSIEFTEQLELLKQSSDSLFRRCELDGQKLQTSLFSWYKFIETEQDLKNLLLSDELVQHREKQTESVGDLEMMQMDWVMLDEKLQQLSSSYLDFVNLCSDSSKLALKEAVMLPSSQLQQLRRRNEEEMLKMLCKARTQQPSSLESQMPSKRRHISKATPLPLQRTEPTTNGPLLTAQNGSRPLKYIVPLALAFVLVGCLYSLLGDSWYEQIGLIFDPSLRHLRGPPPA